ncbi:MAG: hypothetical protein M1269_05430 [Chloroflexi bacterium]|nr:hypothetical protein [Chloroflexota bacterium]
MSYGTVNVKLRPIKLAFLVEPNDTASIMKAIEINTLLWGGMYNPIIPTFKRVPKVWKSNSFENYKSTEILSGYIDAFDPDYVVPMGKLSSLPFDVGNRKIISSSDILDPFDKNGVPGYGIGLFEIVHYFIEREFKFIRRNPLVFKFPEFGILFRLFMASIFGSLPEKINEIFWRSLKNIPEAEKLSCSIKNYAEFLKPGNLFLRRINSHYIQKKQPHRFRGHSIFFLDATKPLDIIDYWNLRAIGWKVIPIAKQGAEFDQNKQRAINFIEQHYLAHKSEMYIYHETNFLKSRNTTEMELNEFVKSLNLPTPNATKLAESRYMLQHWYPRIWDAWARDKDDVECCELETSSVEHDLSDNQERINIRTLDPEFIHRFGGQGRPRFANEIKLRIYDPEEVIAEVIPEGCENLVRTIAPITFLEEWRFSKTGMVFLSSHSHWPITFSIPRAENVFIEWLKSKQWTAEISEPGLTAKQMLKKLGGIHGISILAEEKVIKLLEGLVNDKSINEKAFRKEISKIANSGRFICDCDAIKKILIENDMIQLGIELKCPNCRKHSWYSIKDADYEIKCSKCNTNFLLPSHSPKEIKWSYRALPPFNLPDRADGVYSVLLTLHFFSGLNIDSSSTPIMGFKILKSEKKIEIDFGLFFQDSKFGRSKIELIFGECKSFNRFKKKDIERMLFVSHNFPGSILVFSTLNNSLTEKEKKLIRPLVNQARKNRKKGRPYNQILILTGTELLSILGQPHYDSLNGLCNDTQKLYLDTEPVELYTF